MKYEQPSTEDTMGSAGSLYGEPESDEKCSDERALYGEPCHEVSSDDDLKRLYGEPQHEIRDEPRDFPDVELLFVRLQVESAAGPTVLPPRSESSTASATER
ncbi:hypothetical protein [Halorussus sp. MSC15.2]|uniref:hypothetical protein n=1 Tax=Halorussus sp. MSC15.2 TaxID=2283638 RepID=UPI0019677854|nr:hypothetical protein [Halorussus sp. MSC15.2]